MPKLIHSGEGYTISIETDTDIRMKVFIGMLRDFYKKENLPAQKFETERECTLESKYFNECSQKEKSSGNGEQDS